MGNDKPSDKLSEEQILNDLRKKFTESVPDTTDSPRHTFYLEKTLKEIKREYEQTLNWEIEDYLRSCTSLNRELQNG